VRVEEVELVLVELKHPAWDLGPRWVVRTQIPPGDRVVQHVAGVHEEGGLVGAREPGELGELPDTPLLPALSEGRLGWADGIDDPRDTGTHSVRDPGKGSVGVLDDIVQKRCGDDALIGIPRRGQAGDTDRVRNIGRAVRPELILVGLGR
jgi:hypothetical protein